ncbi:Gustatory receptor 43g [Halyomorpha halys]|nr:Gustatory receptor 43g [Halyomorpha halys]
MTLNVRDPSIPSKMSRSFASSMLHNPIFIASTILGIFPFRTVNGLLKINKLLLCYSVVVAAIVSLLGFLTLPLVGSKSAALPSAVLQVVIYLFIFQYPCCLTLILLKTNVLQETVCFIQRLMPVIYKVKSNRWNSHIAIFFALANVIHPILATIVVIITGNVPVSSGRVLFVSLSYSLVSLGSCLCYSQFSFLLGMVCELYEAEITILRSIKRTVYRNCNSKMMEQFIKISDQIMSVARNINSTYAFQLLYLVSARYFLIIMSMFFIIGHISISFLEYVWLIIGDMFMIFYNFYNCWKICHASVMTSKKSKEFNTLLYQLMIDDTTNEILHNDKLRLHISMKREVVFTACGFFNLDYTLVHSMIASATTYLVILIQFGQSGSAAPESLPTVITNLTTTPLPLSLTTYQ